MAVARVGWVTPSLSNDGHTLAFSSSSENIVPGDTNLEADIFVRTVGLGGVDGEYIMALAAEEVVEYANFGNYYNPARIEGGKWNDLDGNGIVDIMDFAIFADDFGCSIYE